MSKICDNCDIELTKEDVTEKIAQEFPDTVLWQKPRKVYEENTQQDDEEEAPIVLPKKKTSFGNVAGATALLIFLVINLVFIFCASVATGISSSDISEFSVVVNGAEYSVDSIVESTVALDKTGIFGFINQLVDIDKGIDINIGGNVYKIKLSEEILGFLGIDIPSTDHISSSICDSLNIALGTLRVVFIVMLVYLVLVICVNIYAIYSAFGKKRRANIYIGSLFLICGVTELVIAIISAVNPGLFGNRVLSAVLAQMPSVASMFLAAGATGIFGCIIFLIGILSKSRD